MHGGHLPGSAGEHHVQDVLGTTDRAQRFYRDQVLDRLNARMREFIARQEMLFVATSDANGNCDSSFRAGPPGFVHIIDDTRLAYPEYRGNGVLASVGNIAENPGIGMMFLDFSHDRIGLHVNGRATILEDADLRRVAPDAPHPRIPGQRALVWVLAEVDEAYIHCRKHLPRMRAVGDDEAATWGTDDTRSKGGDFFAARETASPWSAGRERRSLEPVVQRR